MKDLDAAREAEEERARRRVGNADDQLVALFIDNVRGDDDEADLVAMATRKRQAKAMERIQARLRRDASNNGRPVTFTALLVVLLNEADAAGRFR